MPLNKLKKDLSISLYNMTTIEAISQGICIACKKPALENCYSGAGCREYTISGLCEKCFDMITAESEDFDSDEPAF